MHLLFRSVGVVMMQLMQFTDLLHEELVEEMFYKIVDR
jgi:hypothetical protein